jgi:type IV pilus assembly protein PilN
MMMRINLLPHREIKRKRQQKEFFTLLGTVVALGVAVWFTVHLYLSGRLEDQQGRNKYLEDQIATLDTQIEEIKKLKDQVAALLQRKKVVEALQANRNQIVLLLDQLVRQLPDGIYLKSVQQKSDVVNITGYTQSNARVSTFMRNMESSPYLENPSLIEIKASTEQNRRINEFSLSVHLTRPKDEEADSGKKPAAPKTSAVNAGSRP